MNTHIDFFEILLKPQIFSGYLKKATNNILASTLYKNEEDTSLLLESENYIIHDVPDYLNISLNTSNKNIRFKKISTYKGSMITLSKYKNLEHYLKSNFSTDRRSKFKTYKKRLEASFDIRYRVYNGEISKEEYERLFSVFPKLIEKRFDLKGTHHHDLAVWDRYEQNSFALINAKKACLFVIYDEDKPISISLNPLLGKVMYGYVRTFDADYSKFYLGFTDLFFQLAWCYENKIEIFDLLKGTYDYKSKLTDHAYFFNKYLIYDTSSFVAKFATLYCSLRVQGFYTLVKWFKKLHIHTAYHRYIHHKEQKKQVRQKAKLSWETEQNIALDTLKLGRKIDWNEDHFSFLRRPIYDFLYTSKDGNRDLEVYELLDAKNAYAIKGKSSIQKIFFTISA
jgi:hypothetical protein